MKYSGQKIAFLTQHGKDDLLRPLFAERLGCELVRATGYDTDLLGTFTRDVQRPGSQLAAARFKAHKAIELSGLTIGMGSEGAFTVDPVGGIIPWHTEVIVWYDIVRKLENIGVAQGAGGGFHSAIEDEEALLEFAAKVGFPSHGLVLRPDDSLNRNIYKGFVDYSKLIDAFRFTRSMSKNGKVFVEVDLRAHMNPTRQKMILSAADDLISKIRSKCPKCDESGFWEKERVSGLPCGLCSAPTRLPKAKIWKCDACGFSEKVSNTDMPFADPSRCDVCNP